MGAKKVSDLPEDGRWAYRNLDRNDLDPLKSNNELWQYWNSLPKLSHVPFRSAIDPGRLRWALPDIAILEREDPDCWRVRLAGGRITERAGINPTGVNYLDIVGPEIRDHVRRVLEVVAGTPCGYDGVRYLQLKPPHHVCIRTLMLPLRSADGEVTQLISAHSRLAPLPRSDEIVMSGITFVERRFIDIGHGAPPAPTPPGEKEPD